MQAEKRATDRICRVDDGGQASLGEIDKKEVSNVYKDGP